MKNAVIQLSARYLAALRQHIGRRSAATSRSAQALGRSAVLLGLETLDLAAMHGQALRALEGPGVSASSRRALAKHAEVFFLEAVVPIEHTHRAARESRLRSRQQDIALSNSTAAGAVTQRKLNRETSRRKGVDLDLAEEVKNYAVLLTQSRMMQEQMRALTRQMLSAQEEERKEISRELHDEVAQTLAGINVLLSGFKAHETLGNRGLNQKIAATQRLVAQSVTAVHQFARDLRPALLDDLGLIPALRSYIKELRGRDGLHIQFSAVAGVEAMDTAMRTVLYRVAQEALTNVVRHAEAHVVLVQITKETDGIRLEVTDDGKSFRPDKIFASNKNKRLGLLGMRERVEMVGGIYTIESALGKGTTVRAEIPFQRKSGRKLS